MTEKEHRIQRALGLLIKYPFVGHFTWQSEEYPWDIVVYAMDNDDAVDRLIVAINEKFAHLSTPDLEVTININANIDSEKLQYWN